MDPQELMHLAVRLAAGKTEVEWRTAVGRAYYSVFHVACQLFEDWGFSVPNADRAHAYLWLRLSNAGQVDVERSGSDLNRLRTNRNWADYNLRKPLIQSKAQDLVRLGQEIVRRLAAADQDPARTQIIEAIKMYERNILKDVTRHP